jgi:prepilin-type N-terminal cleavage/methylation domain-containing protein
VTRARLIAAREGGFTLVEMLSAMTVFSIVLASFSMVLSSAIRHSSEVEEQSNLQVEARAAITSISQDLRQVYDGDNDLLTSPIVSMSPTQVTFYSPDRQLPFHLRRISYRVSGTEFQRAFATSTDTDGAPWVGITAVGPYRKLVGSLVSTATPVFAYKKADGTTATTPLDVKTIEVTLTVATKNSPTRQTTYDTSVTVRGES